MSQSRWIQRNIADELEAQEVASGLIGKRTPFRVEPHENGSFTFWICESVVY